MKRALQEKKNKQTNISCHCPCQKAYGSFGIEKTTNLILLEVVEANLHLQGARTSES